MPAGATEFTLAPGQGAVGDLQRHVVQRGDVFPDIARHYDLGYTALAAANPRIDPWVPPLGQAVTIPSFYVLPDAPHQGIVINLGQWRLFYFPPGGGRVMTFPIGLGVTARMTPLGTTRVVNKRANPTWYPPVSIRAEHAAEGDDLPAAVPPGPDNPLGAFALYLGWKNYRIHGTNKPDGVGRNVSHGCIRLYPDDIAKLFAAVPVGTPVRVVNQPATVGWAGNSLYLQVHPSHAQADEIDVEHRPAPDPAEGVRSLVRAAAGAWADAVDWRAVDEAAETRSGMPVKVAERSGYVAEAPSAAGVGVAYGPGDSASSADEGGTSPSAGAALQQRFDRLLQSLTRADESDSDSDGVEPYVESPQDLDDGRTGDRFRRDDTR